MPPTELGGTFIDWESPGKMGLESMGKIVSWSSRPGFFAWLNIECLIINECVLFAATRGHRGPPA